MMVPVTPLRWAGDRLVILDQTRLPEEEVYLELAEPEAVAQAIERMQVRGAPLIGLAAAFGLVLAALKAPPDPAAFRTSLWQAAQRLRRTRPTAVNLFWALDRMLALAEGLGPSAAAQALLAEAQRLLAEDREASLRLSRFGADLVSAGATVLTHCNTGALATAGIGTALGIIYEAWAQGKVRRVLVDETRPRLQGARLTAWELKKAGVPFVLITDSMAGYFFSRGEVDCVVVGADRIAANGDVANKVGTYGLAVLARHHGVPFYVAAPLSTVDLNTPSGDLIPIEHRSPAEVLYVGECRVAPEGVVVANPAFDVTPAELVTAIVTEAGVLRPPYSESLALAAKSALQSG
ncbi:MAG: S-methyl-5-thioribose-1-phosphate isomerase [Chloroflexota bacterium]